MTTPALPVAFSLLDTPLSAIRGACRTPLRTAGTFLLLLAPLLPLLAGLDWALREGGSAALAGALIGAEPGTPHALVIEPGAAGRWVLAAGFALLACSAGVLATAALVPPAAAGRGGALRRWPTLLLALVTGALLLALTAALVVLIATLARRVQFQLPTVVIVLGFSALTVAGLRLSLWPSIALERDLPIRHAIAASWSLTRGHQLRLTGAAIVTVLLTLVPAVLVGQLLNATLSALAAQEYLMWSPVTIDLVALLPVAAGLLISCVVWGRAAVSIAQAIETADQDSPAGAAAEPA